MPTRKSKISSLLSVLATLYLLILSSFSISQPVALSVSPSVAKPGEKITVTGEGLLDGSRAYVWGGRGD